MKSYALTRKNRMAFYLAVALFLFLMFLQMACTDTCNSRNYDGVCLETVSDIADAPGEVLDEIGESFNTDGGVAPFSGGSGEGICKVTGKNCD